LISAVPAKNEIVAPKAAPRFYHQQIELASAFGFEDILAPIYDIDDQLRFFASMIDWVGAFRSDAEPHQIDLEGFVVHQTTQANRDRSTRKRVRELDPFFYRRRQRKGIDASVHTITQEGEPIDRAIVKPFFTVEEENLRPVRKSKAALANKNVITLSRGFLPRFLILRRKGGILLRRSPKHGLGKPQRKMLSIFETSKTFLFQKMSSKKDTL